MNNDPLIIRLENVRLSFPSLSQKSAMKGKDPEKDGSYKAAFLLHKKTNAATIERIRAAIAVLVKDEFAGKAIDASGICLKEASNKDYDGYDADHLVLSATNSKQTPGVVDSQLNELVPGDSTYPYAGCFVNSTVRLYAQNGKSFKPDPTWGKKINATLRNVQVLLRGGKPYGEPFGERVPDAVDEFEKVEEETGV